jgi:hypothetical protein
MPEYVIKVKSKDVLSGFELALLEARVKNFFNPDDEKTKTEVKAEYR